MAGNGVSGRELFKMLCTAIDKDGERILKDKQYREGIAESFLELAELIQVRLFKVETPFWAIAMMGVVKEVDWKQRGFIDIKIGRPIKLTFNPMFMQSLKNDHGEYDVRVMIGYIITELMRLIYLHPTMFGDNNRFADPQVHAKLERASDVNVSELLKSDMNKSIMDITPSGGVDANGRYKYVSEKTHVAAPDTIFSKDVLARLVNKNIEGMQAIDYYYHIQKDLPEPPPSGGGGGSGGSGDEEGNPDGIATPNNQQGNSTHSWEQKAAANPEEVTTALKDFLQELAEKTRGLAPSGISNDIEKLLRAPERSYKDLFADMVNASEVYDYEPTRQRRNRRFPERLDLFGKKPVGHHHVYIALDSSGSTYNEMKEFVVEALEICREADATCTIIECDARLQKVYDLERPEDFDYKVKGWGGTCFTPVIQFVNGEPEFMESCPEEFKKFWRDPEESILCFFTDGYGESEVPKPKVQKVLWIVSHGPSNLSVNNPYGKVVGIMEGRK